MTQIFQQLFRAAGVTLLIACLSGNAYGTGEPKSASRDTSSAVNGKKLLSEVAGVYKNRFKNSTVNDEDYESEDILEIVPINKTAAYVRMELDFLMATPAAYRLSSSMRVKESSLPSLMTFAPLAMAAL